MYSWRKDTKYYKLILQPNLFGNTDLILCWGRLGTRRGGYKVIKCDTQAEMDKVITGVIKRRKARGYSLMAKKE